MGRKMVISTCYIVASQICNPNIITEKAPSLIANSFAKLSTTIDILKSVLIKFANLFIEITEANLLKFIYVDINRCVLI